MKKLELKHLGPYLPYGLETKYELCKVIDSLNNRQNEIRDKLLTTENVDFVLRYCKPVFRPLSDLTKEIEVNGEMIKPIIANPKLPIQEYLHQISYFDMQVLFELHFDVFGLIDEGLAIDINTLKS